MKFFKLDLLALLISLFILNSCKNQDTIGLGVGSANQLMGNLIDTSTVIVNTMPEDSVPTSGQAKTQLGLFNDPVFGTTVANIAMDLNLPSNSATTNFAYTLPLGTLTIDSAILVMRYASGASFYGDSLATRYKVNVYQLNERLYNSAVYYSNKSWNYNSSTLLGTKTFFARVHDTVKIYTIVSGGPDTLTKVVPELRVPIDKNFVNSIFFGASASQLSSNLIFKNNVKGLYMTMDKSVVTGAGGIIMMKDTSTLDVYYHSNNNNVLDTEMVTLPINLYAAQIKHTYPTAIQTELANQTTGSRNAFYLQGAGLRAKISFPYLKNLLKTLGSDIVINRAELVVTPNPGSITPFFPIPLIAMYQTDIAGQRTLIQDDSSTDPRSPGIQPFGGYYLRNTNTYNFVITGYITDLMLGKTGDYGTYLGPVDIESATGTSANIAATSQTAARTLAIGTDKTSPYRIKLNIIYTRMSK